MSLHWKRLPALAGVMAAFAGMPVLVANQARAENNVAPALVLRQQASEGVTAPGWKAMQEAAADISQSRPEDMNAMQDVNPKTEAK